MAIIDALIQQTPLTQNPLMSNLVAIYAISSNLSNPNAGGIAFYPHERTYSGVALTTTMSDVCTFRASRSGTIVNVYLWVNNVVGSGTSYYNVIVDGSGSWTGSDRLAITSGSNVEASKEDLSIAVTRGDWITLDLEELASGQIHSGPITILVEID